MAVFSKAPLPSGDDVRRVALAALSAAMENGTQQEQKPAKRSGPRKGCRTVAAGAALFVPGRAAYKGRHAILDQLKDGGRQEDGDEEEDGDYVDDEEEPSAEEDADFEDEESDEPVAEEDEDLD